MYTLGIQFSHHASVALLKDNEVIFFCLEERFDKKKRSDNFPSKALSQIKNFTNSIDLMSGVNGRLETFKTAVEFLKNNGVNVKRATLNNKKHHLYHAASVFYISQLDNASCLIVDGAGSGFPLTDKLRSSETTSIYEVGADGVFDCTYKRVTVGIFSLGSIPELVKLYPTSRQIPHITLTDELVDKLNKQCNTIRSKNKELMSEKIEASTALDIGLIYHCASAKTGIKLGWGVGGAEGKMMGLSGYGNLPNATEDQVLAYDTQKELEEEFIKKVSLCKQNNIVIGGGCALNILGNSWIKKTFPHLNIFVDPIAHDGTLGLGAAVHSFYKETRCKDKLIISPYTGINYNITKNYIYECARKYSI